MARLEYANSLAGASGKDCQQRLDLARSQLDAARASPAFDIALPLGPARLASIEYQIHQSQASCPGTSKAQALREALAAAQRAVEKYRDAWDYQAMAVMQFNVAVTQKALGDPAAAITALKQALEMDREYGLHDDEKENEQLLMRWAGPTSMTIAAPAPSSVTLKLAWPSHDADLELQTHFSSVTAGKLIQVSGRRKMTRHVRRQGTGWRVSYVPGPLVDVEAGEVGREEVLRKLAMPLTQGLMERPNIQITAKGDVEKVLDGRSFADALQVSAQRLILEHSPEETLSDSQLVGLEVLFSPPVVAAQAEEDNNLETAAWTGATLQQGEWYTTQAQLMMPGLAQIGLMNDVEFAFTRRVPCGESGSGSCVEIVVHAIPDADAVSQVTRDVSDSLGLGSRLLYWSTTYMRIILDPDTLIPYARETRRYWHISCAQVCGGTSSSQTTSWRAGAPRVIPQS